MTLLNKTVVILIALGSVLGLSACDTSQVMEPTQSVRPEVTSIDGNSYYSLVEKTLPDGTKVLCIGRSGGGLSCNWAERHK